MVTFLEVTTKEQYSIYYVLVTKKKYWFFTRQRTLVCRKFLLVDELDFILKRGFPVGRLTKEEQKEVNEILTKKGYTINEKN